MFHYRCAFLSFVALAMLPLSVHSACRSDFASYITRAESGKNQQIEDVVSGPRSLYLQSICGSSGVKVFVTFPTITALIFDAGDETWRCETNLNMFIFRGGDPSQTALIYDFPGPGGDVLVNGCSTNNF